ncbi:MAG: aldo/keto reductase [Nitrospinales bacterium]
MEYRRFGKTNEMISVITLGGMRYKHGWTPPRNHLPKESVANCMATTRQALDLGINHIETAHGYMKSEHLYGTVLKELRVPRKQVKIMTKGSPMTGDQTQALIEEQLKALQVDFIDFYGWHGINNEERLQAAMKKGGPVDVLHRLKEQGMIGHIGFSTHGDLTVILKAINTDRFSFVNLHYYYFFQRNLPAVRLAAEKDMGIFIISPNEKGGLLWNPSEKVKTLCAPLTPIQFNGRFCLSHPEITTLSMGMHAPEHFAQNLAILNGGAEDYAEDTFRVIKNRMDEPLKSLPDLCTLCNDCLPCPENINIPEILRFHNLLQGYDMVDYGRFRYNMLEEKDHWFPGAFAFKCTECGDCLPRCPENLSIPKLLTQTHSKLFDRFGYLKSKVMNLLKSVYKMIFGT